MNCLISIVKPEALDTLIGICEQLNLPVTVVLYGQGTAVRSMLDLLGIESNEKRAVFTVADPEKTKSLIKEQKRQLFTGVPGHGIVFSVPIKSIGGGKTVEYLKGDRKSPKYTPRQNYSYELIIAIANEGRTDMVMNAARAAGATGGTVLHGKGTGAKTAEKFFNVSIGTEKEILLIVSDSEKKAGIMQSILKDAGPSSEAGAIVFSLPISQVAGFGKFEDL